MTSRLTSRNLLLTVQGNTKLIRVSSQIHNLQDFSSLRTIFCERTLLINHNKTHLTLYNTTKEGGCPNTNLKVFQFCRRMSSNIRKDYHNCKSNSRNNRRVFNKSKLRFKVAITQRKYSILYQRKIIFRCSIKKNISVGHNLGRWKR